MVDFVQVVQKMLLSLCYKSKNNYKTKGEKKMLPLINTPLQKMMISRNKA